VIVHKTSPHAKQLKQMIQWAVTQGQTAPFAAKLTFAKLSTVKAVLVAAEKTAASIHSSGN
jgi:ABC-type phosphate transport system substrate-binding protein